MNMLRGHAFKVGAPGQCGRVMKNGRFCTRRSQTAIRTRVVVSERLSETATVEPVELESQRKAPYKNGLLLQGR